MPSQSIYLLIAVFVVFAIGHYVWRYTQAKSTAEEWLRVHHYRVKQLRLPWFRGAMFTPSWGRNSNNSFAFEAVVDDMQLGGSGTVWLRVWTTWFGEIDPEVEVLWDQMPDGRTDDMRPLAERLADAQLALLRRIVEGETAFYAPRRGENDGGAFDELVEHLLALSRRGMITCSEPRTDPRSGTQYSAVSEVALTPAGQSFLESKSS